MWLRKIKESRLTSRFLASATRGRAVTFTEKEELGGSTFGREIRSSILDVLNIRCQ